MDAACKAHDECYSRYGPSCKCDQEFMRRLQREIDPYTQKGRHARTLFNYMKFQTLFTCGFRRR
nr:hypothetical protein [Virgibacillus oceani]